MNKQFHSLLFFIYLLKMVYPRSIWLGDPEAKSGGEVFRDGLQFWKEAKFPFIQCMYSTLRNRCLDIEHVTSGIYDDFRPI